MVTKIFRITLAFLALFMAWCMPARAQFNPPNPVEPGLPVFYYKVSTSCQQEGVAWTSGDGDYTPGSRIHIGTSLYSDNYTFSHWTWEIDGVEQESKERNFYFTTIDKPIHFVAHYRFTPTSPDDPFASVKSRLYLTSMPEGKATFNINYGERLVIGSEQYLEAYPNQGYQFQGWFIGEECISEENPFYYTVGSVDTEMVAHFIYKPVNPSNPDDDGTLRDPDELLLGDANGDGYITVRDLQTLTDYLLGKEVPADFNEKAADMNGDGIINAQDLTLLTKLVLGK